MNKQDKISINFSELAPNKYCTTNNNLFKKIPNNQNNSLTDKRLVELKGHNLVVGILSHIILIITKETIIKSSSQFSIKCMITKKQMNKFSKIM